MLRIGCNAKCIEIMKQHTKKTICSKILLGGGSTGNDVLFKVELFKDQALIAFPKFSTIAIAFQKEEDENTNLPYVCDELEIYNHIKCNKFYKEIKRRACIEAIKML